MVGYELALDVDMVIAPVTSQGARNQLDVALECWGGAGLLKPSSARASKIISVMVQN